MRAVAVTSFGPPEALELVDLPDPEPTDGEVSIDVDYAAVGFIDVLFRRGDLRDMVSLPFVPGLEVAGRVRQIGAAVSGLDVGQQVVTLSRPASGGYADIALASATNVIPLTLDDGRTVAPDTAVSIIPNAVTALGALTDAVHLGPNESVLVLGAAGGLASVFPGVAKALGAGTVTGLVGSASKVSATEALGYDEVILSDQTRSGGCRYDVIVDPVGGALRAASLDLLRPLGRLLLVGNASGEEDTAFLGNQLWFANASVVGFAIGPLLAAEPQRARDLSQQAIRMVADGLLPVPVETIPLERAADAHRRLEERTVSGKLALATAK